MTDQPTEITGDSTGEQLPPIEESAYAADATPLEEFTGNPADPEQPPAPAQQQLDPFLIAGQALSAAVDAFNFLSQPNTGDPKQHQARKVAAAMFDRGTTLAAAAGSFGHGLVAREQLQLMARQLAEAEAAKREVIISPGNLPNLRRV